ncbi:MAG: response regulator [Candidatus Omnitrophota bacterium]
MAKRKVLIVDDEADIAESLKEIVKRKGCQAFSALKSEEGWGIFQRERPDICCIDIHMPDSDFDGIELLRKIRDMDKDVRCFLLTRVEDKDKRDEAQRLGVEAYFEKPLSSEEFEKFIDLIAGK